MPQQPSYTSDVIVPVMHAIQPDAGVHNLTYDDLCKEISHMIAVDFNSLVNTLYRLDVSETKIRFALGNNLTKDAAEIIADLMLERQLEKLQTRKQFNTNDDIPDTEKW